MTSTAESQESANPAAVLALVLPLYTALAGEHPYDRDLTDAVLAVLTPTLGSHGQQRLPEFTRRHRDTLRRLYLEYGPNSAHDHPGGRYVMARQPEGLLVMERLGRTPLALAAAWHDTLPDQLLHDLAEIRGIHLPQ